MHRRAPPADASVGVSSIEELGRAKSFEQTKLFLILDSVTAVISKFASNQKSSV